jgi:lysyl-tRNA synthetase, class II
MTSGPESAISLSSIEHNRDLRIAKLTQIREAGFDPYAIESKRDFRLDFVSFWFDFVNKTNFDEVIADIAPLTLDYFLHQVLFPKNILEQAEEKLHIRSALKSMGLDPDDDRFKGQGIPEKIIGYREYFPKMNEVTDDQKYSLMAKYLKVRMNKSGIQKYLEPNLRTSQRVTLVGRLKTKRASGKIGFGSVEDESYPQGFQFIFRSDLLTEQKIHTLTPRNLKKDIINYMESGHKTIETRSVLSKTLATSVAGDIICLDNWTTHTKTYYKIKSRVEYASLIEAYSSNLDFGKVLPGIKDKYTVQDVREEYLKYVDQEFLAELETKGLVAYFLESWDKSMTYEHYKTLVDEGDYIQATGRLEYSRSGEPSLMVETFHILTKSLRPLPDKLEYDNLEYRYLNRVADFKYNTTDPDGLSVRDMIAKKSRFWHIWRDELYNLGFLEVECPVFEHTPGGAEAKPFTTFYDVLDQEVYLRISLELPLKKMIAGGFEKVFEIGRIFRNEGASPQHLQEYTQMEFYWAYADYKDCMKFIQRVYRRQIEEITGSLTTTDYVGHIIDWGEWITPEDADKNSWQLLNGWPMIPYYEAVRHYSGGKADIEAKDLDALKKHADELGVKYEASDSKPRLMDLIWKKVARPHVINPIFLILPPVELEPLAKRDTQKPDLTQRFQVVAGSAELGKGFSELNDPLDQLQRFEDQQAARDAGDEEAQHMDMDYVEALEYGLPPLTGFGISERFFSFILGKPIKEAVTFPAVRKELPPDSTTQTPKG